MQTKPTGFLLTSDALCAGYIRFAPLSSRASLLDEPYCDRKAYVENFLHVYPSLPLPASPKSVYRLAHMMDLRKLQHLALEAFQQQLDSTTAFIEYFTNSSEPYEEIRSATWHYIVRNWEEVKKGKGMEAVERMVDEGKIACKPGLEASTKLMKRLM